MKIRVVSSREEIVTLMPNETCIHLAFRPSNKDVFKLVEQCPKLQLIQIPKSYFGMLSQAIQYFLGMQRIQLIQGSCWGARTDLGNYCDTETGKIVI
ncbi:MAG: DUF1699 family protein [Bacteroidales bacterium]